MIIIHIGVKHLIQPSVRLLNLAFILLKLNIDLIHLVAHGMIFLQNLI